MTKKQKRALWKARKRTQRAVKLAGKCEGAGCSETKNLHRHHMDTNKKNNSPENIRTLCILCHNKEHWETNWKGRRRNGQAANAGIADERAD